MPDSVFAFPKQRKEPLTDASHVRNAIARFDQTIGVSDEDRELAFAKEGRRVLWRRYDRDGLDPIGQDSPHRPDGGGPQEVRTQGGGDAQGARARRIVDGARCERTFEFAIEVYAFRVAFVLLLTRRLARSV